MSFRAIPSSSCESQNSANVDYRTEVHNSFNGIPDFKVIGVI